jgi:DNA-binding SARP family transcriptional activator/tetratricopeptide (TPR) repeat protein
MVDHQLQLQVIGPLRVWRDGTPVQPPRSAVQRGLLGVLLLAGDEPLPVGRLGTVVWGDQVGKGAIQVAVSRLRSWLQRNLGPDGPVSLDHVIDGYRLTVPPSHLDLARLRDLLAAAEACTDPAGRFELLRSAMRFCRAPVLADLEAIDHNDPLLRSANHTVRQGVLAFGAAALAAGHAGEAVEHLEVLADEWPFDEPVHAGIIELLAAAEQPAAALVHYERLRGRLADELGVAPSETVQQAYLAVLARDRQITEPAGAAAALPAPAQLPVAVAGFTGRAAELAWLDALLPSGAEQTTVTAVIDGSAGVGKTALAIHWAHRVRDRFRDGQLYVNLRGHAAEPPVSAVGALGGFLRALGEPPERIPTGLDEAAALMRSRLADKRVLIVLDNASTAEQVRPLLPAGAGCLVLVTSRNRLGGLVAHEGAHRLPLDVLTDADALLLLSAVLGHDRVAAEPAATVKLAGACANLPLALRIAAANLSACPAASIAGQVEQLREGNRLAALRIPGDGHSAVRAAFTLSYARLAPDTQRMFRLLGLPPGPDTTPEAAAALAGASVEQARRSLDLLVDAALLAEDRPGRYSFHNLLRLYAAERAEDEPEHERTAATERHVRWYLTGVDRAARRLYPRVFRLPWPHLPDDPPGPPAGTAERSPRSIGPGQGPAQRGPAGFASDAHALEWLDAALPNLVAMITSAARHGPRPVAWLLADALRRYFWLRGLPTERLAVAEAALVAADAEGDLSARAAAHFGLAEYSRARSEYRDAATHMAEAATLCRDAGWAEGEAVSLGGLAIVCWALGELTQAAEHAGAGLALSRRIGFQAGQSNNLCWLGMVDVAMGRLHEATRVHHTGLRLDRRTGNRINESHKAGSLGEAYHLLGRFDLAIEHLTHALAVYRDYDDSPGQAEAHIALAAVHRDQGRIDDAVACARAALDLTGDAGDRRVLAEVHNVLASIARSRGRYADASWGYRRALDLARAAEAGYVEVAALVGLAETQYLHGDPGDAVACAEMARSRARRGGYQVLEGQSLTILAQAYRALQQADRARTSASQALAIQQRTGHRLGAARAHQALADALEDLGEASATHRRAAAVIRGEIGTAAAAA